MTESEKEAIVLEHFKCTGFKTWESVDDVMSALGFRLSDDVHLKNGVAYALRCVGRLLEARERGLSDD